MERPISPFMFPRWYRFQITSTLSILHRFTGIGLALGSILLAWWLIAVAAGGELFRATHAFIASPVGILLLFLWSIAFFYHLCNDASAAPPHARATGGIRTAILVQRSCCNRTVGLPIVAISTPASVSTGSKTLSGFIVVIPS
jgi:succinate dehydrogenase cytochrome b556 subunit